MPGALIAKRITDLKQNGKQEETIFSTVFHAHSHGVIRFVESAQKNTFLLVEIL